MLENESAVAILVKHFNYVPYDLVLCCEISPDVLVLMLQLEQETGPKDAVWHEELEKSPKILFR